MDEAGYGPNLGPLVISVTAWEIPGDPQQFDFWSRLENCVSREAASPSSNREPARLHFADSKQVYSPSRGLASLETSVLALLSLTNPASDSLHSVWKHLAGGVPAGPHVEPWFDRAALDLPLPLSASSERVSAAAEGLRGALNACGVRLRTARSDIMLTDRFNRESKAAGSKGAVLSRASLELLRTVWNPDTDGPALILADKHGGRNRYRALLANVLAGRLPLCLGEQRAQSRYRICEAEIRFETGAERHFPVAAASMVSKYVREVAMEVFNRFWARRIPALKPTKGYPTDARRFRSDIATVQQQLGIPDQLLWRER
ncbi:MAG: hypothetical protein DWQ34_25095 [Planctomycetota bacterium]|nr:MAG: hypothetical protein DWQ34_25095 [Planctomycetota bacterium]REJ91929.1 MAG: hypothetical protein DWQ29_05155 [Planctomycetota bacterium]REK27345.1 MAG: hypothetical protein DWQ41_08260 [Planctomycetota bacterium]REK36633.1 MAG: hypothetical protein DWQ45_08370 [Planctomycetota bacterium]